MNAPEALILFAGAADGWGVGLKRAGIRPVALAESEPERRAALRHHHPEAVIYEDVRHVTRERLLADLGRLPSIVVGSPPCQDISCANVNGRGVDGLRSGLYFDFVRIVGEVRPDWFAAENAAELKTRGFDRIAAALDEVGYASWPQVVGAFEAGYFHLRKRSWVVGVALSDAARKPMGSAGQSRPPAPAPAPAPAPWPASADACQAECADGPLVTGLRTSEIADVGCDAGPVSDVVRLGLDIIERAARRLGLGGRSRIGEHYRMADGISSGMARQIVAAYGDALVPDIAEAFARVMPQLVAELREGRL